MDTAASRPIRPFRDIGSVVATCSAAMSGPGRAGAAGAESVGDGRSGVGTRRTLAFLAPGGFPANVGTLLPVPRLILVLILTCGGVPESGIVDPCDGAAEMRPIGVGVGDADGMTMTRAGCDCTPPSGLACPAFAIPLASSTAPSRSALSSTAVNRCRTCRDMRCLPNTAETPAT